MAVTTLFIFMTSFIFLIKKCTAKKLGYFFCPILRHPTPPTPCPRYYVDPSK